MKGDYFKLKMFVLALAVCVSATAFAQTNVKISGVVLSETNEPLPGVTVLQKGTSNGTTTDLDGAYSLVVPGKRRSGSILFRLYNRSHACSTGCFRL